MKRCRSKWMQLLGGFMVGSILTSPVYANTFEKNTAASSVQVQNNAYEFVTLTFHDVRDDVKPSRDKDVYAVSTKNFSQFLSWLKENQWTPIRLEDVWQARENKKPLPENAVLITIDDGALSSYEKVFPLLKLHQIPAVFAIPTSWINGNTKDAFEAYGNGNLMNWSQMREMQASGLVEFVSHSDNLHHGILSNPQKNMQPAAITRLYDEKTNQYETDAQFKARILTDLKKSKHILDHELGINSRAIFWPYGAVTKETEEIATEAGFPMSFSLGSILTLADAEKTYQRALIMNNPLPESIHEEIQNFLNLRRAPQKQRKSMVQYDIANLTAATYADSDQKLGVFLNQLNALKSNLLILQIFSDQNNDGKFDVAYFPNQQIKMQQNLVNRVVWQAKTRIGQRAYVEIPLSLQTQQNYDLLALTTDLMKNNSGIDGVVLNVETNLNCILQAQLSSTTCKKNVQEIFKLKDQMRQISRYYTNISSNYQSVLKLNTIENMQFNRLAELIDFIPDPADFIQFSFDPIEHPETIQNFLSALKTLSDEQKQHVMVSFVVHDEMSEKNWKLYQQLFSQLKSQSIQKIGIAQYSASNAAQVHQYLYSSLSLNETLLEYKNPFEKKVGN